MTIYSLDVLLSQFGKIVVSCPVLTTASWPACRFLRRQVRWSGIPISWRIFLSLLWSMQSKIIWLAIIKYYDLLRRYILILKANWKMRGFIWSQYLHSFFTLKSSEHSPVGQWKSSSDTFILRASTPWYSGGQRRWNVRKRKPSDHKSLNCVWSEIAPCTYHTIPGCHRGWTVFKKGAWAK